MVHQRWALGLAGDCRTGIRTPKGPGAKQPWPEAEDRRHGWEGAPNRSAERALRRPLAGRPGCEADGAVEYRCRMIQSMIMRRPCDDLANRVSFHSAVPHAARLVRQSADLAPTAFDPDPAARRLFCFTHPDDELAVCAWLRRLASAGTDLHLSWTHRTAVREAEAREMARLVGVPEDRLVFHAGDDGRIADQMPDLLGSFSAMIERVRPHAVYCAAFEQGHLDHDATHCLVSRCFVGPVYEFPMYHPYTRRIQTLGQFGNPDGEEVLELTPEDAAFKSRVSRVYRSQNIRSVIVWYTVYRALCLRPARLRRTERLRLVRDTDYLTPSLPEPWRSEVARSAMWRRWVEAVKRLDS